MTTSGIDDLVCVHAAASGPETWDALRPGLERQGYRVHRPTLLGHRDAPRRSSYPLAVFRDQLVGELDRRGVERCVLVGHSLGAVTASMLAQRWPDRVSRVVLEEMPVLRRDAEDRPPSRRRSAGLALRAFGLLNRRRCDPVLIRDVLAELRAPQPTWWAGLGSITAPTLLLAGGPTSHLDQSRYALLAEALPDATLSTIEAGHHVHRHAPDRWVSRVTEFLDD